MTQDKIKNRIQELYQKYLSQTIDKKEFEELFVFIKDDSNKYLIESIIDDSILIEGIVPQEVRIQKNPVKEPNPKSRKNWILWTSAAAAVLLLIVAFVFVLNPQEEWETYTTGFQETKTIELPDGSTVVMNASSELKWKEGFEVQEQRIVFFKGEGFFDISHRESQKFIVKTEDVDINVLGTKFNLESRNEFTNVYLEEGKVVLKSEDLAEVEMKPGDLVKFDQKKNKLDKVSDREAEESTSWKEGVFTFTDMTGFDILEKMTAIYGKEFEIRDSSMLKEIIVVQGLPYADWNFTKEALELTLHVTLKESIANKIIVDKK